MKYPFGENACTGANQQKNSLVHTVTHLGLLGVLAASLTFGLRKLKQQWDRRRSGRQRSGRSAAGGSPAAGTQPPAPSGWSRRGWVERRHRHMPAASSHPDCTTDAGVVTGSACAPNPLIFPLDANCTLGYWSGDGISNAYFYQPWCNNANTTCTLTMACATNSMHIAGSYSGYNAGANDGNAGWGGSPAGRTPPSWFWMPNDRRNRANRRHA